MNFDNFTVNAQEALLKAQQAAAGHDQQVVDTPHLIRGIFDQDEHTPSFLLQKCGVSVAAVKDAVDQAIDTYPKVSGGEKQYLSSHSNDVIKSAQKLAKEMGVEFAFPTQTVHLFNEKVRDTFSQNQ